MSDTKRLKRDAVSAEEAEEYQAASSVDEEQLENGEDGAGEGEIAAEGEHDYAAEDNEFIKALEDVQEKLVEVSADGSHITQCDVAMSIGHYTSHIVKAKWLDTGGLIQVAICTIVSGEGT